MQTCGKEKQKMWGGMNEQKEWWEIQNSTNAQGNKKICCFLYLQPFMTIRTSSVKEKGDILEHNHCKCIKKGEGGPIYNMTHSVPFIIIIFKSWDTKTFFDMLMFILKHTWYKIKQHACIWSRQNTSHPSVIRWLK